MPAQHRKAWGLKPGDQIAFDPPDGKSVRIEPRRKRSIFERLDELKLPLARQAAHAEDIDDAITEAMIEKIGGARRRHDDRDRHECPAAASAMTTRAGERAHRAFEGQAPVFVNDVVLAEFAWTCARVQMNRAMRQHDSRHPESTEFVIAERSRASRDVQNPTPPTLRTIHRGDQPRRRLRDDATSIVSGRRPFAPFQPAPDFLR